MKALEKDRTRRYQTPHSLAMDIQRFLNSEPILARPPVSNGNPVISAVMVAIGINSGESDAMPLFVGIMGTVAGVLVLVAFLAPRWDRKRALRNARETVISENGLYTQGTLYTWGKVAARLRGVSLREEKGRNHLVFSIDAAAQVGVPQYINHIVEVPVPDGEEAAARDLVDRLSRQCDSGQD